MQKNVESGSKTTVNKALRNTIFSTPALGGTQKAPQKTVLAPRKPLPMSPSQKGENYKKPAPKPVEKPAPKPASQPVSKSAPSKTSTNSSPTKASTPAKASSPVKASTPSVPVKSATQIAQEQAVKQEAALEAQRKAIEAKLRASTDAYYNTQVASLGQARDAQVLALEKAYQNAVDEGELSIEEATMQFDDAKKQIDSNSYLDSQRTSLLANQSGIQNSQQMLGLVAGDNARTNDLVQNTTTERDRRINTIRDRIGSITKQKDLDVVNARSSYDFNVAQARGTADQMFNEKVFGLDADNFASQREQQYKRDNMDLEQRYKLDLMSQEQKYNSENMARQAALSRQYAPVSQATKPSVSPSTIKSNVTTQYQNYQKAKTTTPTDNYYNSMTKAYNFPVGTSQKYIDNFHSKWTPPPAKNGLMNAWEKSQAMFGRN